MSTSYKAKWTRLYRWQTIAPAAFAFALVFAVAEVQAQPPRSGDDKTIEARVQSLTTAPMGELDGAVLDDGTLIHWPPHLADRFTSVVRRGDQVKVSGWMETGPAGDTHLEVQTVTNLRTNASVENEASPPPPPPGRGRRLGPPPRQGLVGRGVFDPRTGGGKTTQGRIKNMTTAPMGEMDGAVLDDGTVIHWPPHLADRFASVAIRGDQVKVSGWMETGPAGDTHLEVQTATNLRTNASASNDSGPLAGRAVRDGSADFAPSRTITDEVDSRLRALEKQVAELREEIQRLRDEL